MPTLPLSARRHYLWSLALVERAVREAAKVRDTPTVASVIAAHQVAAAQQGQTAVGLMLTEQGINEAPAGRLNPVAFTTAPERSAAMLEQVRFDYEFDRIVASLVQDAGRAAEQVATTVRPRIGYVRFLSPPSCSRCAVLAGRIYRHSQAFQRHPLCDCTMVPTTLANDRYVHDPVELMRQGQVTGLSKADQKAINDGADFAQVVNVRREAAGLRSSGRVLSRNGRPTPEAIYAQAQNRDDAIERLIAAGYVR